MRANEPAPAETPLSWRRPLGAGQRERRVGQLRRIALAGAFAFAAVVAAQHALAPQLGPARHTISEYVNADDGVLMIVGFVTWAGSLLATAALAWTRRATLRSAWIGGLLAALVTIASVGIVVTAAFPTQTSAGLLPPGARLSASGRLHDLASGAAMQALVASVIVSIGGLSDRPRFQALAAVMLATCVVASVVLLSIGDSVDGIRQRLLIAAGLVWQVALICTLSRSPSDGDAVSGT